MPVKQLLVAASVLLLLGASQKDKKSNEERLCAVFVSAPESEDGSSVKVVKEVEKKIKDEKKWFRLAEDPLEADIRIEITQFGRSDQLKLKGHRTETTQGGGGTVVRPGLLDLDSGYFIDFLLTVPRQFKMEMTTAGRNRGSAAKDLARRLRTICDTYCR
jgi:hypothetical protein